MILRLPNLNVSAIAAALPRERLVLADMAEVYGELDVRRIIRSTGVESVRVANSLGTGDLCAAAAQSLFEAGDLDRHSIDAIVLVTQTPDFLMPATSVLLQHRLGLSHRCLAFDINYGCSGYIYGLYQAALLVAGGGCRRVLLCTGDVITKLLHPENRNVRMLFGDAATATLIEAGSDTLEFAFRTDGGGVSLLNTPLAYGHQELSAVTGGYLHMDGADIMSFALSEVPPLLSGFLQDCGLAAQAVQIWALHQANVFMLDYLRKALKVPRERLPVYVKNVGNTGPSSIPLMLSQAQAEMNVRCREVLCCGFGVGLSMGVARVNLEETLMVAPVEVEAGEPMPARKPPRAGAGSRGSRDDATQPLTA